MIGSLVGSYRILERLGGGGMGTVYRGRHILIGRQVAIKVLHPSLATEQQLVERFVSEATLTASIEHPGVVEVFDFGVTEDGVAYLVMEHLEGVTLAARMRERGAMSEGVAAMYLRGVCSALVAAHARGIIHRDLKPENIFLIPDRGSPLGERTKVLDFGIAKSTELNLARSVTCTGAMMGTPRYMSPEQCRGATDIDPRADLYALGCIWYEMLCGRLPFVADGVGELLGAHLFVAPEPPSRHVSGISPEVERIVMTLLAKAPDRRVQTARELAAMLTQVAQRVSTLPLDMPYDLARSFGTTVALTVEESTLETARGEVLATRIALPRRPARRSRVGRIALIAATTLAIVLVAVTRFGGDARVGGDGVTRAGHVAATAPAPIEVAVTPPSVVAAVPPARPPQLAEPLAPPIVARPPRTVSPKTSRTARSPRAARPQSERPPIVVAPPVPELIETEL